MRKETVVASHRPPRHIYGASTPQGRDLIARIATPPEGTPFCASESEKGIQVCVRYGRYDDAFPFIDAPWFARCYLYPTPESDGIVKLYNCTDLHRYAPFTECGDFDDALPFTVVAYDADGVLLEKYVMNLTRGIFFHESLREFAERWEIALPDHDADDPEILHLSVDFDGERPTGISYYLCRKWDV